MTATPADLAIQPRAAHMAVRRGARAEAPMSFADMVAPAPAETPGRRPRRTEKAEGEAPPTDRPAAKRKSGDDAVLPVATEAAQPATSDGAPPTAVGDGAGTHAVAAADATLAVDAGAIAVGATPTADASPPVDTPPPTDTPLTVNTPLPADAGVQALAGEAAIPTAAAAQPTVAAPAGPVAGMVQPAAEMTQPPAVPAAATARPAAVEAANPTVAAPTVPVVAAPAQPTIAASAVRNLPASPTAAPAGPARPGDTAAPAQNLPASPIAAPTAPDAAAAATPPPAAVAQAAAQPSATDDDAAPAADAAPQTPPGRANASDDRPMARRAVRPMDPPTTRPADPAIAPPSAEQPPSPAAVAPPSEMAEAPAEDLIWLAAGRFGPPATTESATGLASRPGAMRVAGTPVLTPAAAGTGPAAVAGSGPATLAATSPADGAAQPAEGMDQTNDAVRFTVDQPTPPAEPAAAAARDPAQPPPVPTAAAATADIDHAAPPREAASPHRHLPSQAILDQVAVHVSKAVRDGVDGIRIQLRPAALGQLEINLEVTADGRVTAAVTADNQDTLNLLQRDARGLERALHEAGLKADTGGLSFSLRGEARAGQEREHTRGSGQRGSGGFAAIGDTPPPTLAAAPAAGGIDIRV